MAVGAVTDGSLELARLKIGDLDSVATRSAEAVEHLKAVSPEGRELLAKALAARESPRAMALDARLVADGVANAVRFDEVEMTARVEMAEGISARQRTFIQTIWRESDRQALRIASLHYGDVIEMAANRPHSVLRTHLYHVARAAHEVERIIPIPISRFCISPRALGVSLVVIAVLAIGVLVYFGLRDKNP